MTRLVNPNRVNGHLHDISTLQSLGTDPCNVLFVSDRVMYLLANYATKDVMFYGRYALSWPSEYQAYVLTERDPETEFVNEVIEAFQLETSGDNVEIANALNNIAQAILAQVQCCDGPTNTGTGGASGQETAPSGGVDNGTNPPNTTNFATYGEYETYKCNIANYIVDNADASANTMQTLSWNSILALPIAELIVVLAASLATPIPGDEIVAMAAILALWGGAFQPVFDNLELAIDNHRQDLVCALFTASDVAEAKSNFRTELDLAIDAESTPGGLLNTVTKGVSRIFISTDNLNKLFTQDDSVVWPTGSIDCSVCATGGTGVRFMLGLNMGDRGTYPGVPSGGIFPGDGVTVTITAVQDSNGFYYASAGVYEAPSQVSYNSNCDALPTGFAGTDNAWFRFRLISYNPSAPGNGIRGTQCHTGHSTVFSEGSVPLFGQDYNITWFQFIDDNPFSLDVQIEYPKP